MASFYNLLLDKRVLIHLGNVLAGVNLVMASLGERNYEASSQAAASEHRHNAEVKKQSAPGIHLLSAGHSSVAKFRADVNASLLHLRENEWLLIK